jgi:hypothetical protein
MTMTGGVVAASDAVVVSAELAGMAVARRQDINETLRIRTRILGPTTQFIITIQDGRSAAENPPASPCSEMLISAT